MSRLLSRIAITLALLLATLSWTAGPVHQAHAAASIQPVTGCDQTSFTNAITAAGPGGTVQFAVDCPASTPLNRSGTITLSADVSIDGNGHNVTIVGSNLVGLGRRLGAERTEADSGEGRARGPRATRRLVELLSRAAPGSAQLPDLEYERKPILCGTVGRAKLRRESRAMFR
jgi:hypothetical protein